MALKEFLKRVRGNVVYIPGHLTKEHQKTEYNNNKEVLEKLGISFITLPKESYTGLSLYHAGYTKEAQKVAEQNYENFKKKRVYKVITSSPEAYHTFKTLYPKWIPEWEIEVEHTTQTILQALKKRRIAAPKTENVSYHDPCFLGRYEKEYESARKVIEMLGGNILEPRYTKKKAMCCGAGGNVQKNYPKEARDMAKQRINHFPEDVKKIITPAGCCLQALQKEDSRVLAFATFVLQKIRGLGL